VYRDSNSPPLALVEPSERVTSVLAYVSRLNAETLTPPTHMERYWWERKFRYRYAFGDRLGQPRSAALESVVNWCMDVWFALDEDAD
jgi:hypothetical protein